MCSRACTPVSASCAALRADDAYAARLERWAAMKGESLLDRPLESAPRVRVAPVAVVAR